MKTVGIIGGGGFIGSYVTKQFLENGYRVKVSATDISTTAKYAHLSALPHAENMELAPLDVQNLEQLKAFAAGCDILVHGGTPFQLDVEDVQRDLFDPTIKGTENFLRVVSETPTVKKVVFIASVAAMNTNFPLLPAGKTEGDLITEADPFYFSEENIPYAQAKFLAHQVVEQFIADHPNIGFEITTVSPTGVMGMAMSAREDSTSMGLQFLLKNKIAPNPFIQMLYDQDVYWALVDVADVAESVYKAATFHQLHGKNYLISGESYRISDISLILNGAAPVGEARTVYSGALATQELSITFKPVHLPLSQYAQAMS
ncbi:MAG TPA: NAD-dependent epimerase/dehydratase family protein [Saprospiraceae bacterium]|nr:NAD-dependent epimerase/dehydratase family protein [Saprospiraceae bacterium]HMP25914.1 NAD-dependent epimerase/dehydratase family protein [Saprospiraceae bacterium]